MKQALLLITTIAMTALAGLIAWAAWEYSRPLLGELLSGQVRAFVLEFRFVIQLAAVIVALGLGEWLAAALARRFTRER